MQRMTIKNDVKLLYYPIPDINDMDEYELTYTVTQFKDDFSLNIKMWFVDQIGDPTPSTDPSTNYDNSRQISFGVLSSGNKKSVKGRGKQILLIHISQASESHNNPDPSHDFSFIIGIEKTKKRLYQNMPIQAYTRQGGLQEFEYTPTSPFTIQLEPCVHNSDFKVLSQDSVIFESPGLLETGV